MQAIAREVEIEIIKINNNEYGFVMDKAYPARM